MCSVAVKVVIAWITSKRHISVYHNAITNIKKPGFFQKLRNPVLPKLPGFWTTGSPLSPIPYSMWNSPPKQLKLSDNDIHVWRADLNLLPEQIEALAAILSADESDRANRFRFEKDRNRFIAARAILRSLLATYLNLPPSQLEFIYGDRGKPSLSVATPGNLSFNLSHSKGLALYAITRTSSIGIDLEYLRNLSDALQLAKRFFSHSEYEVIAQLSPPEQQRAFFKAWTAKEAYLKAKGSGLSGGLEKVEISIASGYVLKLLSIDGDASLASSWSLYSVEPHPDYLAALAIEKNNWNLSYWDVCVKTANFH
jgi:4'-phosphopantetheinyl transferase